MNSDYVSPREPKPSEEYKELLDAYKVMHKDERAFMGISLIPLTYVIKQIFNDNKIKSFLRQWPEWLSVGFILFFW